MIHEARKHLINDIIPFWKGLRDDEQSGYYGLVDFDGNVDKKAEKGCILHSRILWFFSNAYLVLKDKSLLSEADHAYRFITEYCIDREYGGIYWSMNSDGTVADSTKHTYNQAFCIYALSSYYDATGNRDAIKLAGQLQQIVEQKCTDEVGYLEAFNRDFTPADNDKLSENGVIAEKTMNTLLHVMEGYTEYYRVTKDKYTEEKLKMILDTLFNKIYNSKLHRQEVFFDKDFNTLIDLHSYGHDIETSWLAERSSDILADPVYMAKMRGVSKDLADTIYKRAYKNHSLLNECERGVDDTWRIWWVQAEAVLGFYNAYIRETDHKEYLEAAEDIFGFIQDKMVNPNLREWYWRVDENGNPDKEKPIVEPWKCPYHNGRMCIEIIKNAEA